MHRTASPWIVMLIALVLPAAAAAQGALAFDRVVAVLTGK